MCAADAAFDWHQIHAQRKVWVKHCLLMLGPFRLEVEITKDHFRRRGDAGLLSGLCQSADCFHPHARFVEIFCHWSGGDAGRSAFNKLAIQPPTGIAFHTIDVGRLVYPCNLQHCRVADHHVRCVCDGPYRSRFGHAVEFVAVQLSALHCGIKSPGEDRPIRVVQLRISCLELIKHTIARRNALLKATRALLVDRADICQSHEHARHTEMGVRIDKAGENYLVVEGVVDGVFVSVQPRPHCVQGADRNDPAAGNRHRLSDGSARIHRADAFGDKNSELFHDSCRCPFCPPWLAVA